MMGKSKETREWAQFVFDNIGTLAVVVVLILLLIGALNFDAVAPIMDKAVEWFKALRTN